MSAEEVIVIISATTAVTCSIALLYQTIKSFKKLRLACLVASLLLLVLSVFHLANHFLADFQAAGYWVVVAIVSTVYTNILVICILDMGRNFYSKQHWNTLIFKITSAFLIIFNILDVTTSIAILTDNISTNRYSIYVAQMMLGMTTTMLALSYAFRPVFCLHWNPNVNGTAAAQINPRNAAVATWYMAIMVTLSLLYMSLYTTCIFLSNAKEYLPITNSIDTILKSALTLILALPPPKPFIETLKSIIISRRPMRHAIQGGGVMSTGLFEGHKYEETP